MRDIPKDIILFGLGETTTYAWHAFTRDSAYRVVAFTVDAAFVDRKSQHDLPVIPFETIHEVLPPWEYAMHLPIGWKGMNSLRAAKFEKARSLGYPLVSYVSSQASVWPGLRIGSNCELHQQTSVGPGVNIGDNCMVYAGATLGHDTFIGDHCFIGSRATICGGATIGEQCVIGANCTITDGVKVAPRCFIGAGALINRDTLENRVYTAAPAVLRDFPADRMRLVAWDAGNE